MVTVHAIFGESNTRKSSSVRALTGVARFKEVTVTTNVGDINVFVRISALQESEIDPQAFIAEVTSGQYENVLVPLRIFQLIKGNRTYPDGSKYIQDFIRAGWHIRHVVVLGIPTLQNPLPSGTPKPNYIPLSTSTPVNKITSQIRYWWDWL